MVFERGNYAVVSHDICPVLKKRFIAKVVKVSHLMLTRSLALILAIKWLTLAPISFAAVRWTGYFFLIPKFYHRHGDV